MKYMIDKILNDLQGFLTNFLQNPLVPSLPNSGSGELIIKPGSINERGKQSLGNIFFSLEGTIITVTNVRLPA